MSNEQHDQDNTEATDTEGHMPFRRGVEPAGEDDTVADTEGHGFRGHVEPVGEDDTITDTDGHGRFRGLEDATEGDVIGDADAEGHRFKRG